MMESQKTKFFIFWAITILLFQSVSVVRMMVGWNGVCRKPLLILIVKTRLIKQFLMDSAKVHWVLSHKMKSFQHLLMTRSKH